MILILLIANSVATVALAIAVYILWGRVKENSLNIHGAFNRMAKLSGSINKMVDVFKLFNNASKQLEASSQLSPEEHSDDED